MMNTDGSGKRMLIDGQTATDEDPAWSPDGTRIAFTRNGADIWAMNADGSGPANLTNTPNTSDDEVEPAWSPDGRKIAFTSDRPGSDSTTDWEIWRMRATDGANPTNLTENAAVDFDAEWQPVP